MARLLVARSNGELEHNFENKDDIRLHSRIRQIVGEQAIERRPMAFGVHPGVKGIVCKYTMGKLHFYERSLRQDGQAKTRGVFPCYILTRTSSYLSWTLSWTS